MIKEVIVSITNRCNLKCRMCDIPLQPVAELTAADWKKAIDGIRSAGTRSIVFSGGEPLLRGDIFDLIRHAKGQGLGVCLTSNGMAVDAACAGGLAAAGLDVINISLEGPRQVHEFLRGRSTFDRACLALEHLRRAKVEATVAMMVSSYNFEHMPYVVSLAGQSGVTTVKFQPFSALFLRDRSDYGSFFIPRDRREECLRSVESAISLAQELGININPASYLRMIPDYLADGKTGPVRPCPALLTSCPVTSDGRVFPCWNLTEKNMLIGELPAESFERIWNSPRRLRILDEINRKGCPGCLMSCYDESFGGETLEIWLGTRLRRAAKKGAGAVLRAVLRRWRNRIRFYGSYRGSFAQLASRAAKVFSAGRRQGPGAGKDASLILSEIEKAKKLLAGELKNCRK